MSKFLYPLIPRLQPPLRLQQRADGRRLQRWPTLRRQAQEKGRIRRICHHRQGVRPKIRREQIGRGGETQMQSQRIRRMVMRMQD